MKGDYQWKCQPIGAVTTTGNFDLTVKVPKAEGLLYFDNFTRIAEGTVNAAGEISVTSMDTIVMTGHVNPSASGNALTGSGEIKNVATAWGEAYSCSGTWSTR